MAMDSRIEERLSDQAGLRAETQKGRDMTKDIVGRVCALYRYPVRSLAGETLETPYREIAVELGISESALKVTIHRLRKKFGSFLRQEVSRTLSDPNLLDEEMRFLQGALSP